MNRIVFLILIVLYACQNNTTSPESSGENWTLTPFIKVDSLNPILKADSAALFICPVWNQPIQWERKDVFNPATVVRNDTLFLLYRAEDSIGKFAGTSRIGLAWSLDGLHFTKFGKPVLFPENDSLKSMEWEGGCEDPRIVEDSSGRYIMTYTSYDGKTARLMTAFSNDLYNWQKTGAAFAAPWRNLWSKSGSIICREVGGKMVAQRINGKYWMYYGDTNIFLAESDDLLHWQPILNASQQPLSVFGPRKGKFDSDLVEPGPPAIITSRGILLLYNSRNVPFKGDSSLAEGTYAAAQILLDSTRPDKVLNRMDTWFLKPEKDYEVLGQVNHVCFIEGLANYKNSWFLYYGTADSRIAVAIKKQN